ncbi:MAG: glycoside hydrolase family 20 zincin-like fold domain-containing protein [Bacteroidota bacterium]
MNRIFHFTLFLFFTATKMAAQQTADIFSQNLLPVPQQIKITQAVYQLDKNWVIQNATGVNENDAAVTSIKEELEQRFQLKLSVRTGESIKASGVLSLMIQPGSVIIGETTDTNRIALSQQAYRLTLEKNTITIKANAAPGLFYGVQTLLQLLKKQNENIVFPQGEITDWPDLNLRMIYWDDAHHLEYLDVLKREIKQASYFKINAFALKLEGHFQYEHAKPIVEPHALTAKEYQELTDYALAHYVQLVPYLDAPAHVSFILKHPEYAYLRSFPNSNYEMNVADPRADSLVLNMFDDLINANKGVEYIVMSNDEAYYTGKSPLEKEAKTAAGGNSRLLAQFITRISNELHKRGRKVLFWGEYPLTLQDIKDLPSHLINGVYDSAWAATFKSHGMRQTIYTYTQGEEPLFPDYYPLAADNMLHKDKAVAKGNVANILETIQQAITEKKADLMGVIVAGWADAGLHPQTFWLGYATGAAVGWNNRNIRAEDLTKRFYNAFYGSGTVHINRVYELLSKQAQFFDDSWEWYDSDLRSPIFGNHAEVYKIPKPALDQTLQRLPVPDAKNLSITSSWTENNKERLRLTGNLLKDNDELLVLLHQNIKSVTGNRYNLEVMLSVAQLCRQNLMMIKELAHIDGLLMKSSSAAASKPALAVLLIDQSIDLATELLKERNKVLNEVVTVWYKDWRPLLAEVNGRKYLLQVDDVKDHEPVRTIDMSYLVYRQLHYPLDKWASETLEARNAFARQHKLAERKTHLNWSSIK